VTTPLIDRVLTLVDTARAAADGQAAVAAELDAVAARLREPLRVAIAGTVKAGKSTLLNALVGEVLAPTDAGECTRVVTWYREGIGYRATVLPAGGGPAVAAPIHRGDGGVEVDLGGRRAEDVDRIEVEWPAAALRTTTFIDTPGLHSLSGLGARTASFLAPDDDRPTEADAVIYLTRHLHGQDVRFLEAFHDRTGARSTPVNAIAVLSRADEIGGGRPDSLQSAARIAERYRGDPTFRRYCQTVVPVAGLLAEAAASLTEAEYRALGRLAQLDDAAADALLASADRFVDPDAPSGLAPDERRHLLGRMGVFGVRLGRDLLRHGHADNARRLAEELRRRSGLDELRRLLATAFTARRDLLKANAALVALADILRRCSVPGGDQLRTELERIQAGAHELAELRVLTAVRAGEVVLTDAEVTEVERVLGPGDAAARAGVSGGGDAALREAVLDGVQRWRSRAENPLSSPAVVAASQVVTRTLESLLADELRGGHAVLA
jgi:hypothetical protein